MRYTNLKMYLWQIRMNLGMYPLEASLPLYREIQGEIADVLQALPVH